MVIMAGMLPGVECARRRRVRQSAAGAAEAPCGTRRASFCLHTGGHDHAHLGSAAASKERSSVCKETMMARAWTLDSNVREAKERLDQKLRGQRETAVIIKRHQHQSAGTTASGNHLQHSATAAMQREVLSTPATSAGGARRRRFRWSRLGPCGGPPSASTECAVCLDELRAGDVVAHLPCAHRFHWSCAVPWVRAASRCPVCRARIHLAA